uniref:P-type Ca(2+) transporter n=1 Tax=Romanomermis culicivorax TaxID=13658 RepID=A0A915IG71_ROMCU
VSVKLRFKILQAGPEKHNRNEYLTLNGQNSILNERNVDINSKNTALATLDVIDLTTKNAATDKHSISNNDTNSRVGETLTMKNLQGISSRAASLMTVGEICDALRTDQDAGLTHLEAGSRQRIFGYNEFEVGEHDSLFRKYIEQFKNPLILLLLGSAIVSLVMKQFDDAVSITVAIVIVVTVAFVQEYRSEKSLEELTKLVPPSATAIRSGQEVSFLARELVPGDVIVLKMGDRVPADCRLVEAIDMQIDESSFTGEPNPVRKVTSTMSKVASTNHFHDIKNIAFMGTLLRCGKARVLTENNRNNK